MDELKAYLLDRLGTVEGVEHLPSPVSGGSALFHRGTSFAHFHHDHELDLRLTRQWIRRLGLSHPADSLHHPKRSPNSAWIEIRFTTKTEADRLAELVKIAVSAL